MRKNIGLTVFASIVFAFLFIPLFIIAVTAFGGDSTITFPIHSFSLKWFANVFVTVSFLQSFKMSVKIAMLATLLALLVGTPAAYALARFSIHGKGFLKSFFLSPTIVPGIVVGFSLYRAIVLVLHIPVFYGLWLGHFLAVLPYIIRVVGSSLKQFDFSIEEVAWSLGCPKMQAFFQIVLPNITSGVTAAFMLAFINSLNNIPISMFLTGPGVSTFPTNLMNYIEYNYDPTVSAFSVIMMFGTIIIMFLVEKTLGIASLVK